MRRILCACCLILLVAFAAYAEDEPGRELIGELITDYKVFTIYEIPGSYLDKPLNIKMPSHWDGNMERVRVKAVYLDSHSPSGTSAYFVNPMSTPKELLKTHTGEPVVRISVDTKDTDVLYIHFVFGQKEGAVCE